MKYKFNSKNVTLYYMTWFGIIIMPSWDVINPQSKNAVKKSECVFWIIIIKSLNGTENTLKYSYKYM